VSFIEVARLARRDGLDVVRGQAKISSALGDPFAPRADERWEVDLAVPRFRFYAGDELLFGGECQLIGTFVESDGFLWGFQNPSVTKGDVKSPGVAKIEATMRALPELESVLVQREPVVDDHDALREVAAWIAVRAGYTGAFIAPVGNAVTFLAVKIDGSEAEGAGREPWCCACGRLGRAVKKIIAGPDHLGICDVCIGTLADILEASDRESEPSPPADDFPAVLSYCQFCGDRKGGLIMCNAVGICPDCAKLSVDIVKIRGAT
jgi:hypothetical protein